MKNEESSGRNRLEDLTRSEGRSPGPLSVRLRRLRLPLLGGIFAIIYLGLLLVFFQQQQTQKGLNDQITSKEQQLLRPVVISEKVRTDYEAAQQSIPRKLAGEDVILAVLGMAEKQGFNVTFEKTGIVVVQKAVVKEKVGTNEYEVLSFTISGIKGDYEKVKEFISALYSVTGLETLVLRKVSITQDKKEASATIDFSIYNRP